MKSQMENISNNDEWQLDGCDKWRPPHASGQNGEHEMKQYKYCNLLISK